MQGILLIGMPGAGKSSLGKKVAKLLGFSFIDGDTEIEKQYPDRQGFLDARGDKAYIQMEEGILTTLPTKNSVLSPGGSIIYSEKCRQHFSSCYKVFLNASLDTIRNRLTDLDKRGIVYLKRKGLEAIYQERKRLYKEYADIAIDTENKSDDELAKMIVNFYNKVC